MTYDSYCCTSSRRVILNDLRCPDDLCTEMTCWEAALGLDMLHDSCEAQILQTTERLAGRTSSRSVLLKLSWRLLSTVSSAWVWFYAQHCIFRQNKLQVQETSAEDKQACCCGDAVA